MADAVVRVRAVDETRAAFASVEGSLRKLSGTASLVRGAFGGIIGAAGIGGLLGIARDIGRAVTEAEQSEARLNAVLRATQGAVGLTRDELAGLIDDLAGKTLFDDEALRNASAVLLTFKNVSGDAFRQTLSLATDLSALLGGDLNGAVLQLGKALEDPVRGMQALRRVGVSFTEVQEAQVKNLVETNRLLDAQGLILGTVSGQLGGVAREMNSGLVGAATSASKAWNDLLEAFGRTSAVSGPLQQNLNAIAFTVRQIEQAIQETDRRARQSILFQANPNLGGGQKISDILKEQAEQLDAGQAGAAQRRIRELTGEQAEALRQAGRSLPKTGQLITGESAAAPAAKKPKRDDFATIIEQLDRERQSIQQLSAEERLLEDVQAKRFKLTPQQERIVQSRIAEVQGIRDSRAALEDELKADRFAADAKLENLKRISEFNAEVAAEQESQRLEVEATVEAYRRLADPTRVYRQELEEIARLQASGDLGAEEATKAREAIEKQIDAVGKKTNDVGQALGLTFSSAIEDAIVQMRDLGDIADAVFQDLTRLAVRKAITEPLLGAASQFFDSAGGGAGIASLFGLAKGGIIGPGGTIALDSFATGGIASRPTLAMISEGGMNEAVIPLPDGRRVPVDLRGRGGGGQQVAVTMNVYAQDAASFRRSERQILGALRTRLRTA